MEKALKIHEVTSFTDLHNRDFKIKRRNQISNLLVLFFFLFFSTSINASTVIPLTVKTAKDATYGGIYLLMFCPLRHNENGRIKESVNNSSSERGIIETSMRAGEEDEVKTSHRINIYMMIYIYIYIKKLVQVEKVG